ncbi:hypothetical protein [Thauera humireducens]|uniref:hypothetical protein n=1 Tax=Thauera humireducens TaxID=1134435 RepID=UPI00311D7938
MSAGIGCHAMAMWMGRNVVMGTHMGAEGTQWIGMAPFTEAQHIFQNMGDGTYAHSGGLAIRYAASTGVNITFKLLRNAHTSMTGGQAIQGEVPVVNMVADLLANGVKKIIVTPDDPSRFNAVQLPGGTEVWHRDRIDEAHRTRGHGGHHRAAARPGMRRRTAPCAPAAARPTSRRSGRHQRARVCEGCGDCGEVQLHVGRAGADRVWPQDAHPPVLVQQGLQLREGLLPRPS